MAFTFHENFRKIVMPHSVSVLCSRVDNYDCTGTRKAYTRISSFLDANFVYGSSKKLNMELRTGKYGLLKSNRAFSELGLQDLLPLKVHEPDRECIRKDESQFCFQAGKIWQLTITKNGPGE